MAVDPDLVLALTKLASLAGTTVDPDDEHSRWALYDEASQADHPNELYEAAVLEPDPSVASALVVRMVEVEGPKKAPRWINVLPDGESRAYASRRADEIVLLRAGLQGRLVGSDDADVQEWTDWLQLRLAEFADDPGVLRLLAEHGRTKRIRRIASSRA